MSWIKPHSSEFDEYSLNVRGSLIRYLGCDWCTGLIYTNFPTLFPCFLLLCLPYILLYLFNLVTFKIRSLLYGTLGCGRPGYSKCLRFLD